eukprot:scaffold107729_cov63-Phaeocystis_antarctica.AAC.2
MPRVSPSLVAAVLAVLCRCTRAASASSQRAASGLPWVADGSNSAGDGRGAVAAPRSLKVVRPS